MSAPKPVRTVCVAEVEAKPIDWLWKGRIARGVFTLIAGKPGEGKSQLTCNLAATVTSGGRWPDGTTAEFGSVFILSAEDSLAQTIRPRLEVAGAELNRCHYIEETGLNLAQDLARLSARISLHPDAALVIVDPLASYLGRVDSHRNAETRAALTPLAEFAASHNVAVVCIVHLNKGIGTDALMRVGGSVAFTAAARAVFLVSRNADRPEERRFILSKNNLGADTGGYSFTVEMTKTTSGIDSPRIVWGDAVSMTADESLAAAQSPPEERGAREEAEGFLKEILAQGPVPSREIEREAAAAGISEATLKRARRNLGVKPVKDGMRGVWLSSLDPKALKKPEGGHE